MRLKSRPQSVPLPRRSRPTKWLRSIRILPKQPSAMNKPEFRANEQKVAAAAKSKLDPR